MGFLERIQEENLQQIADEAAEMLAEQRRLADVRQSRDETVLSAIKKFATEMGMEAVEVKSTGSVRYFLVGDLVFFVRIHAAVPAEHMLLVTRYEVLWQHRYGLVGIERTNRLVHSNTGTLGLINFDSVKKVVVERPGIVFEQTEVLRVLMG